MRADDPRHGQMRGYVAGCRADCCLRAKVSYDKTRRWELHTTGRYRKLPAIGAARRLQALQCLGWSVPAIAARCGIARQHLYRIIHIEHPTTYVSTLAAIETAYNELCMTHPPATTPGELSGVVRVRNHARRNGWAPPLAWDDIDDPNEQPDPGYRHPNRRLDRDPEPDPAVINRFLNGDHTLTPNIAERMEIIRQWIRNDGTIWQLEHATGWNIARDIRLHGHAYPATVRAVQLARTRAGQVA